MSATVTQELSATEKEIAKAKSVIPLAGLKGRSFVLGLSFGRYFLKKDLKHMMKAERIEHAALDKLTDDLKEHKIREIMKDQKQFHDEAIEGFMDSYKVLLTTYMLYAREWAKLHEFLDKNPSVRDNPEFKKFLNKYVSQSFEVIQGQQRNVFDLMKEIEGKTGMDLGLKLKSALSTESGGVLDYYSDWRSARGAFKTQMTLEKIEKKGVHSTDQLKALTKALQDELSEIQGLVKNIFSDWRQQAQNITKNGKIMKQAKDAHEVPGQWESEEEKHNVMIVELNLTFLHSLHTIQNQLGKTIKNEKD
jgi:hypothetical protein